MIYSASRLFVVAVSAVVVLSAHYVDAASAPSPDSVLAAMALANSYFIGNVVNGIPGDCGWERGTYFVGNAAHIAVSGNATLVTWATGWAESHNWACKNSTNGNDQVCGGAYAALYDLNPQPERLAGLQYIMDKMAANTTFVADWFWVDALFMALPTWMAYGARATGAEQAKLWNKSTHEYIYTAYQLPAAPKDKLTRTGLWSAEHSLWYRDSSYFPSVSPNGMPVFWGRGNGWASAALARAAAALPAGHPLLPEFEGKLLSMALALAPLQGADGLWRANLLDAAAIPTPETTSSAGITHALAFGVRTGVLPAATFAPIVWNAWAGLSSISLHTNGSLGWCQPVGAAPGPATESSQSDFCLGLWLLAAAEVYKLAALLV